MQPSDFTEECRRHLVKVPDAGWAFVPPPLPRRISLTPALQLKLSEADRIIGRLAGVGASLLNPRLLIRPLTRREAVLSSRIEGTNTTIKQLAIFEAQPNESAVASDTPEVFNYHQALEFGLDPKRELPMSLRLIRDLHRILMRDVRRSDPTPGEFRRGQNYVGTSGKPLDARYVPPPVPRMKRCLDDFEKFLHAQTDIPPLIRLAMIHYQFEAIHPFLDGNGRVGRLLLSVLPCEYEMLPDALLHLSAFFESHRDDYYDVLRRVSTHDDWNGWLSHFLDAAIAESEATIARIQTVNALRERYQEKLRAEKQTALTARLVDQLFVLPITTTPAVARSLKITHRGAQKMIDRLVQLGIVKLMSDRKRGRLYWAPEVLAAFES